MEEPLTISLFRFFLELYTLTIFWIATSRTLPGKNNIESVLCEQQIIAVPK